MDTQVLLEVPSHSCPIYAIVEQDDRVAYFYLWSENEQYGVKSCWVRNLKAAPQERDTKAMEQGLAPMLPKSYCKQPEGLPKLNAKDLSVVWLEEGDAAALLEKDAVIAIIPSWSGYKGFSGYASACQGENDFAWELNPDNHLFTRIKEAQQFIDEWQQQPTPFQQLQPQILESYHNTFGQEDNYFAINAEGEIPKGLYVGSYEQNVIFGTVAVSLRSQPQIEMYTENPLDVNRFELAMMLNNDVAAYRTQEIGSWISGQTNLAWDEITYLAEGHTIPCNTFSDNQFTSVLLTRKLTALPTVSMPSYRQSRINLLWIIPIFESERQLCIDEGSQALVKKLQGIGKEIFSLNRNKVI